MLSIPDHAYFLYLYVRKPEESFVSIHEEDAIPVYSHNKPAYGQRRSCGQIWEHRCFRSRVVSVLPFLNLQLVIEVQWGCSEIWGNIINV